MRIYRIYQEKLYISESSQIKKQYDKIKLVNEENMLKNT